MKRRQELHRIRTQREQLYKWKKKYDLSKYCDKDCFILDITDSENRRRGKKDQYHLTGKKFRSYKKSCFCFEHFYQRVKRKYTDEV